jgi:hypothetical protein
MHIWIRVLMILGIIQAIELAIIIAGIILFAIKHGEGRGA